MRAGPVPPSFHIKPLVAELPLGALRAEHQQILVGVEVGPPLVGRVLAGARLPAIGAVGGLAALVDDSGATPLTLGCPPAKGRHYA